MSLKIMILIWIAFAVFELIFPRKKLGVLNRRTVLVDVSFALFNGVIFWQFWPNINAYVLNNIQIPQIDISRISFVIQAILIFLIVDFLSWLTHVMLHKYSFLWKIHKTHHKIREMNFLRVLYYNPLENIIYSITARLWLIFLVFNPEVFLYLGVIEAVIGYMNHANTKLKVPVWIAKIINTPQVHIWHHDESYRLGSRKNYGISLSVWDWIFGTLILEKEDPKEIGI